MACPLEDVAFKKYSRHGAEIPGRISANHLLTDSGAALKVPTTKPDKGKVDELTKEFVAESQEGLERMELCLTELEHRPGDSELVSEIFRTVHTIKGTTSFLGFTRLLTLAHAGESLLGALRDGTVGVSTELITSLLHLMDGLRTIVGFIDTTGKEQEKPGDNDAALIEVLNRLKNDGRELNSADHPAPLHEQASTIFSGNTIAAPSVQNRTLRIDVEMLNHMMNLVGELVLTRNQILQSTPEANDFPDLARRLDTVTADLRESVRQARMQPVGHLFAKFPRMVRDLAQTCGRRVRIEFEGQETGLDKTLLEAIRDPLTHAVRNSVDHGIEAPEQRIMAGKSAEGVILLRAFQQSGSVVIEVIDDGGGIPAAAVLKKALDRGLVTADHAARMTERETLQLIFAPGISLSPTITHVSGRGVGMDVVRTNVQKVGGSVEVESLLGTGTTLRLRVPLTLAIVPALVARSGGQSFALPQHSLTELVHLKSCAVGAAIERIGTSEVFRLREGLLPIVRLDKMLQLAPATYGSTSGPYIAVMEEGGRRFGLVIDDLNPPEEIVVKPLSSVLRNIGMYSGATVLGNGALALILDVKTIADRAGHRSTINALAVTAGANLQTYSTETTNPSQEVMVVYEATKINDHRPTCVRMAIPLPQVERIEQIPINSIEFTGDAALLQYRGEVIQLEDQGRLLAERAPALPASQCDQDALMPARPSRLTPPSSDGHAAMVTVMICLHSGASSPKRYGIVVQRVLNVSLSTALPEDRELGSAQLAMVDDRVMTVRPAVAGHIQTSGAVALGEVA